MIEAIFILEREEFELKTYVRQLSEGNYPKKIKTTNRKLKEIQEAIAFIKSFESNK